MLRLIKYLDLEDLIHRRELKFDEIMDVLDRK